MLERRIMPMYLVLKAMYESTKNIATSADIPPIHFGYQAHTVTDLSKDLPYHIPKGIDAPKPRFYRKIGKERS